MSRVGVFECRPPFRVRREHGGSSSSCLLKLHCARHTWATLALRDGKSGSLDQLDHSDPALTLRVYAHAMRDEEDDLSFADFGGPERFYPAPAPDSDSTELHNYAESMARREGLEPPTLRFEVSRKGQKKR
jgi:hypothetical protein